MNLYWVVQCHSGWLVITCSILRLRVNKVTVFFTILLFLLIKNWPIYH